MRSVCVWVCANMWSQDIQALDLTHQKESFSTTIDSIVKRLRSRVPYAIVCVCVCGLDLAASQPYESFIGGFYFHSQTINRLQYEWCPWIVRAVLCIRFASKNFVTHSLNNCCCSRCSTLWLCAVISMLRFDFYSKLISR